MRQFTRDYGSLIVGVIALVGVSLSIAVNEWRTRRQSRLEREDQYRNGAREKLSAALMNVHDLPQVLPRARLRREMQGDLKKIDEWQDRFSQTTRIARTSLLAAHLYCQESEIRSSLRAMDDEVRRVLHECLGAVETLLELEVGENPGLPLFVDDLGDDPTWTDFFSRAEELHVATVLAYPPTVRERSFRTEMRRLKRNEVSGGTPEDPYIFNVDEKGC
jgi:hypothetical protein